MISLRTTYMGLTLANPLVASASPLTKKHDNIKRMEDAGLGAIVFYSRFEEQIKKERAAIDHYTGVGTDAVGEALSYFPQSALEDEGQDEYLAHIQKAKESVDIPIIGSINGVSPTGWTDYAKDIQDAGADALELNLYNVASDLNQSGAELENQLIETVKTVRDQVTIPIAVKLSAFFSAFGHVATRLDNVGADALVLFNRFYQPDMDVEFIEVTPSLHLSSSNEMTLPLRWIAILSGRVDADLAATTGVHTNEDVVKYLMGGAQVVMTASALLKKGIPYATDLINGLENWMDAHEYESVDQLRGCMSQENVPDPNAFQRANYVRLLSSYAID